jgi:hypothetical protein
LTTVVLLVLALAWGGVLFFWFRSRSESSFADSVGLFHRHLHVLAQAAPGTRAAANRLRSQPVPFSTLRPIRDMSVRAPQPLRSPVRTSGAQVVAAARRRQTQRRRRDVLFILSSLTVATFVVAVVTRGPNAITAQLLCDFALGSYVALLVRIRNLAAERQLRMRPFERAPMPAPRERPAARRRLAPSYALSPGYGMPAGYSMASGYETLDSYGSGGYADANLRRTAGGF